MEYLSLRNGVKMPVIGFGTADMKDKRNCEESVLKAIHTGYRMIDTAAAYENEDAVGQAVKRSGIPREKLFLTTKIWIQDYGYEKAVKAFYRSMDRLGTDYVDLYLIHQPIGDIHGTWRAVEEMYKKGYVKAVGVSNFEMGSVAELDAFHHELPHVDQVEMSVFCQQKELVEYLMLNGVKPEAWGIFARGEFGILEDPVIKKISLEHGKTAAQVVLRWLIQRGIPVLVQPKDEAQMTEDLDIFDFSLGKREMDRIAELDTGKSVFVNYHLPETIIRFANTRFDI